MENLTENELYIQEVRKQIKRRKINKNLYSGSDKYYWSEDTITTLRENFDCENYTIDLVEGINQWVEDNISNEYEEDYIDMGVHLTRVLVDKR